MAFSKIIKFSFYLRFPPSPYACTANGWKNEDFRSKSASLCRSRLWAQANEKNGVENLLAPYTSI